MVGPTLFSMCRQILLRTRVKVRMRTRLTSPTKIVTASAATSLVRTSASLIQSSSRHWVITSLMTRRRPPSRPSRVTTTQWSRLVSKPRRIIHTKVLRWSSRSRRRLGSAGRRGVARSRLSRRVCRIGRPTRPVPSKKSRRMMKSATKLMRKL